MIVAIKREYSGNFESRAAEAALVVMNKRESLRATLSAPSLGIVPTISF
jgi:hypothetical protein